MKHIAIVEDESTLLQNYTDYLSREGYKLSAYSDVKTAKSSFSDQLPDLVVLDISLGEEMEGGFELCRFLRSQSESLPIIFLTARDNDFDTISGLRLGADDYLTKDISLPHLGARIQALFRRMVALQQPEDKQQQITLSQLLLDTERMTVQWANKALDLTVTEFWLLHSLVKHPGHVRSREQLMQEANTVVDDSTITSHIKRIRKKFQQEDKNFDCIDTVYGMGYRWQCKQ